MTNKNEPCDWQYVIHVEGAIEAGPEVLDASAAIVLALNTPAWPAVDGLSIHLRCMDNSGCSHSDDWIEAARHIDLPGR